MTVRKPHIIRAFDDAELNALDDNFGRLYSHKLESRFKYEGSSSKTFSYLYQDVEHGEVTFSANGSRTVTQIFPINVPKQRIISLNAHAISDVIAVAITDITNTAITLMCRVNTAGGGGNTASGPLFSNVTTASIRVFYSVVSGE